MIDSLERTQESPSLDHLKAMLVPAGVTQFGIGDRPDYASGTCLDDNVRALLVAVAALSADPAYRHAREIGDAAIAFMERARRTDGRFRNMADIDGDFLEELGSEESQGRTVWACGVTARCATVPEWRETALRLLIGMLPALGGLKAVHARAYSLLGLTAAIAPNTASAIPPAGQALSRPIADAIVRALLSLADMAVREFQASASFDWSWWSPTLTWGNGRLPEAMLVAGLVTGKKRFSDIGMRSLEFLARVTQTDGMLIPIGNDGWYPHGGRRAVYDQQPIEACAMVGAWLAAYRLTGDRWHRDKAAAAYRWFSGHNTEGLRMADERTGACFDGLLRGEVNRNCGAESTVSYLQTAFAVEAR